MPGEQCLIEVGDQFFERGHQIQIARDRPLVDDPVVRLPGRAAEAGAAAAARAWESSGGEHLPA
ncbi:hypothetical protein [Streptomyces sp. NPDC056188]|uniref:hypothetical protein n=1 Tax=Streptomyces sp. NPDC056188 TaxID=3345740 RepID=UPI0035D9C950